MNAKPKLLFALIVLGLSNTLHATSPDGDWVEPIPTLSYDVIGQSTISATGIGSQNITGSAQFFLEDPVNGYFEMTIQSDSELLVLGTRLAAISTSLITGSFDTGLFIDSGILELNYSSEVVTSCQNTGLAFGGQTLCNGYAESVVGSLGVVQDFVPLNVDASNISELTFATQKSAPAEFLGQVTVDTQYQLVQSVAEVPVPAAAWLFGSALLGLAGLARSARHG